MREQTTEANPPIEQEFLSVIREYERVIYKVCYLYANPNAPLNDLYQDVLLNLWKAILNSEKNVKYLHGFIVLPSTHVSVFIVKKRIYRKLSVSPKILTGP